MAISYNLMWKLLVDNKMSIADLRFCHIMYYVKETNSGSPNREGE